MAKNVVSLNFNNTDYSLRPYATCSTSAGTANKTVSIPDFELFEGATVLVKFSNGNTAASPTLNVNNKGAKSIKLGNNTSPLFQNNDIYEFIYNGTDWDMIGVDNAVYESELRWGNTGIQNGVTPVDAAMVSELSQNRLSFLNPDLITIEFTRNNGTDWYTYPKTYTATGTTDVVTEGYEVITDAQKQSLITDGLSQALYLGARKGNQTVNDKLRITIVGDGVGLYINLKKILFFYSQANGTGNYCLVEAAYADHPDEFETVKQYNVSGWTNWNSIPFDKTLGEWPESSRAINVRKLRLTFGITGVVANATTEIYINKLRMFGPSSWAGGNSLTSTGHLYTFDINKNVTFPANLTVKGNTILGDASSDTVTAKGPVTFENNLIVKGSTTLGDATSDTITAKTSILPSGTINLGSSSAKWNNVYINNINGTAIGNYALKSDIPAIPEIPDAYELPTADNDTLGGIKTGYTTSETDKNYAVQVDNLGNAFVNVPWTGGSSAGASSHITVQAVSGTSYSNTIPANTILDFTSTNVSGTINITGFGSATETDKLTTYGLTFKTSGNAKLKWPTSTTIYWVNGEYPGAVNPGSALPAAVYEIIITYAPGSKRYTATYAKYK